MLQYSTQNSTFCRCHKGGDGKPPTMLEVAVKEPRSLPHVLRDESPLRRARLRPPQRGPQAVLVTAALLTAAALLVLPGTMPTPLILPIVSTLLLFGALVLALVAWRRPRDDAHLPDYWDTSGALTLASIVAALLSEPDAVLPLMDAHLSTDKTHK
jgi:hypothetical protein